jgi:hypothetical protein
VAAFPTLFALLHPLLLSSLIILLRVLAVYEDLGFVNPVNHFVVHCAGGVRPGLTRHGVTLLDFLGAVECLAP